MTPARRRVNPRRPRPRKPQPTRRRLRAQIRLAMRRSAKPTFYLSMVQHPAPPQLSLPPLRAPRLRHAGQQPVQCDSPHPSLLLLPRHASLPLRRPLPNSRRRLRLLGPPLSSWRPSRTRLLSRIASAHETARRRSSKREKGKDHIKRGVGFCFCPFFFFFFFVFLSREFL